LRVSASVFLKNYIADYFYDSSYKAILNKDKIMNETLKNYFKENILTLMLNVENSILPHIIEMIKIVVQNANGYLIIWPKLMDFIGEILEKHDSSKSRHIYDLITKIIKRYHIESKSDSLFREIIYTMDKICKPMTDDAINIIKFFNNYDNNNSSNNEIMTQCLQMMNKIMSIFYSLNYQDFPEFFEDHLTEWITILNDTLLLPNKTADISKIDPSFRDMILKVKAKTLKNINLYYSNYYEDIEQFAQGLCSSVWTLMCKSIIVTDGYSKLMKELLDFFKSGFQMGKFGNLKIEQINQIFEYIISPNLSMTLQEKQDFEENPVEFMKIEFEEYDMSSNKYYSINLLQIIISNFPEVNKNIIVPKIAALLNDYNIDKNKNWNNKILAINLLFASCIKTFAQRFGVTELNSNSLYTDIDSLINEIFLKEFKDYNSPVIIQVYSLKFLSTFRLQITDKNKLGQIILLLIDILNKCCEETQNACLLCLDLIINMKDLQTRKSSTEEIINNENIFNSLISSLLNFISKNTNIFAMRCFFRTLKLTEDKKLQNLADSINNSMDAILKLIIKNSQIDEFNFYFFETCALIMKKFCINNNMNNTCDLTLIKNFQNALQSDLNLILQNNITDLLGYSFQIFAFYLFLTNDNNNFYQNILNNILTNDKMWDINMQYLYPPSIDYIKVILITNKQFCENEQIINLLFKICQTLMENKSFNYAFQLIEYLINFVSTDLYGSNLTQFLKIINLIAEQNMTTNPRVYSEINQEMILILAKLSLKINLNLAMEIVKILSPENPIEYLIRMIEEIPNFKSIKNKKMVIYFYSQILATFFNSFDNQSLVKMTAKLLNVLKNFYGINFKKYYGFSKKEDMSYAANNYNKLNCANIEYHLDTYKIGEECDENKIFFQAQNIVKQNKKIDFVSEALKSLKGKELDRMKSFVQQNEYTLQ
jgi:exportin-2 (importin alpha re-exporter)